MPVTIRTGGMKYKDPTSGQYTGIDAIGIPMSDIVATNYTDLVFPVSIGQHCIYNEKYYVANTAIAESEEWTSAHWTEVTIDDELGGKADKTDTVLNTTLSIGRAPNTTVGTHSVAFGSGVEASGSCSFAVGAGAKATGGYSVSQGAGTTASGSMAHAEGSSTTASNVSSHAEGCNSTASGVQSHAEGLSTIASGTQAHAEGQNTTASGMNSHAEGWATIAQRSCQTVSGYGNVADTAGANTSARGNYIEIVGNGADTNNRSNARTLDWNGNERLKGDLYVGCNADSTGGNKVATEADLTLVPVFSVDITTNPPSFICDTTFQEVYDAVENGKCSTCIVDILGTKAYLVVLDSSQASVRFSSTSELSGGTDGMASTIVTYASDGTATMSMNELPFYINLAKQYNQTSGLFPVTTGDYCINNAKLYKAKVDIASYEAFNSSKWEQVTVGAELNTKADKNALTVVPVFTIGPTNSCDMTFADVVEAVQAHKCNGCICLNGFVPLFDYIHYGNDNYLLFVSVEANASGGFIHHRTIKYHSDGTIEYDEEFMYDGENIATPYEYITFPVAEGTLCYERGTLWKANQDIPTQEEFDYYHWDVVSVADELGNLKSAIQQKYTKPQTGIPASDLASGVIPSVPVTDVRVSGTSVVSNGVANVPVATDAQVTTAVDAYLSENFSNPSNPPLDRTLASNSSATPADISGRIKTELSCVENKTMVPFVFDWKPGNISTDTGELNVIGTRHRVEEYITSKGMWITNGSTVKFFVYYYSLSGNTYTYDGFTEVAAGNSVLVEIGKIVRFCVRGDLTAASLVTGTEGIEIVNDLKGVRSILLEKNSAPLYPDIANVQSTLFRGVTYTRQNGTATFSGTVETSDFLVKTYGGDTILLSDFKVGKKYFVTLNKVGTGDVRLRISKYDANQTYIGDIIDTAVDTSFVIDSLEGVAGINIRYHIPVGKTVNCSMSYSISDIPNNKYLYDQIHAPLKLRLMQYNTGMFNFGLKDPIGIPSEDVADKILNYKKFLCEFQPDIACMQECTVYMDRAETITTESVFSPIMPNMYRNVSYQGSERGIFSIKPAKSFTEGWLYSPDGGTTWVGYYQLMMFDMGLGKEIAVMTTALSSTPDDADMAKRQASLTAAMNVMSKYEYAFIILDMNNSGNIHYDGTVDQGSERITSDEEGETLLAIAKSMGFNFANGGYLPFQNTLGDHRMPNRFSALDNIVYKDNGKIVFKGFTIFNDHLDKSQSGDRLLSSDHYPVFGDFVLI